MKFHLPGRRLTLGLVSGAAVLLTVASVQAQESGGFFEQLFGVRPAPAPAPVQPTYVRPRQPEFGYVRERRRLRADRPLPYAYQQRLKTRYAALPKAEAIKTDPDKIAGKQPVDQKAIADNPTKAILADKTLRPGDIVILPAGPKVYTGGSEKHRRLSDFEDVKNSQFLGKKTRLQLLAMMVPVGALPADQARKVMAMKLKLAHPDEIEAIEANNAAATEPTAPRQIMPWTTTR